MPRRLAVFVAVLAMSGAARDAGAERARPLSAASVSPPAAGARLHGIVRDDGGRAIGGASVLALGATRAAATSDAHGRFSVVLPPGDYVLGASRAGYAPAARERVRVKTNAPLERNITLVKTAAAPAVGAAVSSSPPASPAPAASSGNSGSSTTEAAWLLRHLPRTALRDEGLAAIFDGGGMPMPAFVPASRFAFVPAVSDSRADRSSALAGSDLSGEVHLLTTNDLRTPGGPMTNSLGRGVASLTLGAPLGAGDWSFRTALAGENFSSWTLATAYTAHDDQPHAIRLRLSYGSQTIAAVPDTSVSAVSAAPVSRSVGGIDLSDRWRVRPSVSLDYGVRLERYDYLDQPDLVSPRAGVRVAVARRITVAASASDQSIAPGAEEFQPPSAPGPWLPPERTFSALDSDEGLQPERVRRVDVGADYALVAGGAATVGVRRVGEWTDDQLATLFDAAGASDPGHYTFASLGNVAVTGWTIRLAGRLGSHVRGAVNYLVGDAEWSGVAPDGVLASDAASVLRQGRERVNDVQLSLEASVPRTATRVSVALRANAAFSRADPAVASPSARGRFNVEIRQDLPFRPLGNGRVNLLFAARTLLRDLGEPGAVYDELLTVAPPTRLTGGVEMWF